VSNQTCPDARQTNEVKNPALGRGFALELGFPKLVRFSHYLKIVNFV
jgi:hypothetical protein